MRLGKEIPERINKSRLGTHTEIGIVLGPTNSGKFPNSWEIR